MHALLFLYDQVLKIELQGKIRATRARQKRTQPEVPTRDEAKRIIDAMTGPGKLIIALLYGSGLRISECLRLRVKDLLFETFTIQVKDAKGGKDRTTILPRSLVSPLQEHLKYVEHADY